MKNLEKDIDPTPLILIFSDEDCPSTKERDFYRKVVINQVRSCLLCDLHPLPIGQSYQTTANSLLMKTTDDTFKYLVSERQKKLERLIRENVFKKIISYWGKKQPGIHIDREMFQITWNNKEEKQEFLDWLEDSHTEFITEKPGGEERSLFDNINDISREK